MQLLPVPTFEVLGIKADDLPPKPENVQATTEAWLKSFSESIQSGNIENIVSLFTDASPYWRDLLAVSWEFRSIIGKDKIREFLSKYLSNAKLGDLKLKGEPQFQQLMPNLAWIHLDFTFTTEHGIGYGIARLLPVPSANGLQWKTFGVFTNLEALKKFPEQTGALRDHNPSYGEWAERRVQELEFREDPQVLIIGGAQGGLMTAARLKYLGVSTLVVVKQPRIGDQWRGRYEALSLHDPVWYDHMPYIPFPPTWPVYPAAAKLADWLESYANILDLNVWTSAEAKSVKRDTETNKWIVEVERAGKETRTFKVNHVVFAIGFRGGIPKLPSYPGMDEFEGPIMHATHHRTAKAYAGKKVVVLGAATSGHDVCGDCVRHGVDVTMYQRGATHVISAASVLRLLPMYSENGPPVEVADRLDSAIPMGLTLALSQIVTNVNAQFDKETLDSLRKVGFNLGEGPDGSGVLGLLWSRAGGYYFDQGVSKMIADGRVKLKHGSIKRFAKNSIEFEDGSSLPADVVVCATGYDEPEVAFKPLLGPELASRLKIWELDEEGEVSGLWRRTEIPNLWVMMGNLKAGRFHSSHLALQIKAIEEGILS